jgi:hypothetical protein
MCQIIMEYVYLNMEAQGSTKTDMANTFRYSSYCAVFSYGRVLARHNIKSVGLLNMKLSSLLRPVKDHLGLRTPGVYRISCECGRVYIGQTGRFVDIRLKEHQRYIRLEHPDRSAVAEHSIDQGHRIQFHNASILATKTRYMDRIVRVAIEIELHPYNIKREGGFCLSKSWKPRIGSLKLSGHDPRTLGDTVRHS